MTTAQEIDALRGLIVHCWLHQGYPRNGYDKMTTAQRELYDRTVDHDHLAPRSGSPEPREAETVCRWPDDRDRDMETGCGGDIDDTAPIEWRFCPFCGKRLVGGGAEPTPVAQDSGKGEALGYDATKEPFALNMLDNILDCWRQGCLDEFVRTHERSIAASVAPVGSAPSVDIDYTKLARAHFEMLDTERRRWTVALAVAVAEGRLSPSLEAEALAHVNGYVEDDPAQSVLDEAFYAAHRDAVKQRAPSPDIREPDIWQVQVDGDADVEAAFCTEAGAEAEEE